MICFALIALLCAQARLGYATPQVAFVDPRTGNGSWLDDSNNLTYGEPLNVIRSSQPLFPLRVINVF
jgi:hypothetical protein